jgi:uncharacterized protein (DUF1330 family)
MVRSPSLGRAVLLLLQQLHQRSKRRRRQSHAPLQSREQAGKAALGNDLAGALPPRAHKPGPSYASAQFAKEDAAQKLAAKGQNRNEFVPKVLRTIKDHGGRFIVRNDQVTGFVGDAPKRIVITGWESLDDVKKWQASKEYVDLKPLRDASVKTRSFAVATCENPQGAKPGQTKCPF